MNFNFWDILDKRMHAHVHIPILIGEQGNTAVARGNSCVGRCVPGTWYLLQKVDLLHENEVLAS